MCIRDSTPTAFPLNQGTQARAWRWGADNQALPPHGAHPAQGKPRLARMMNRTRRVYSGYEDRVEEYARARGHLPEEPVSEPAAEAEEAQGVQEPPVDERTAQMLARRRVLREAQFSLAAPEDAAMSQARAVFEVPDGGAYGGRALSWGDADMRMAEPRMRADQFTVPEPAAEEEEWVAPRWADLRAVPTLRDQRELDELLARRFG
eukprot:TRINITY_DN3204_c0_g1_i2.p1 TRINITY_DN3204_c0_g1~~TRINITY_DN3204_c0_g1_i2.p1  ORF type:complete len:206 (-),score=60.09 TRINITY_DN3204_c0_g1_i2:192-809(-)